MGSMRIYVAFIFRPARRGVSPCLCRSGDPKCRGSQLDL